MRNRLHDHVAIAGDGELWRVDFHTDESELLQPDRDGERCICGNYLESGWQCERCKADSEPSRIPAWTPELLVLVVGLIALCVVGSL